MGMRCEVHGYFKGSEYDARVRVVIVKNLYFLLVLQFFFFFNFALHIKLAEVLSVLFLQAMTRKNEGKSRHP